MSPFEFFAYSSLLRVRSWLIHPFQGHCEEKTMRDEVDIFVAGHPLLSRRLEGRFHSPKRNFLYYLTDVSLLTKL